MPERLLSLLHSGKTAVIGHDGEIAIDDQWHPPVVDEKQRMWIEANALPQLDAYLAPAKGDDLTGRITVLLSHFFVAKMPAQVWAKLIEDWVRALSEFPMWAIEAACDSWMASEERKPTPAAIRRLAVEVVADASEERRKLRATIALPPPANELVAALIGTIPPLAIVKWISPLSLTVSGDMAVVRCPGAFHRDWVQTHYAYHIAQAQKGRYVRIIADGDPEPSPMTEADKERMRNRLSRMLGIQKAPPLYAEERMGADTKDRVRAEQRPGATA